MNTALRRIGVNVLGDMPWGTHVCMFYQSKDDLFDTVGPYFKAGLESNEFCLWFPSAPPAIDEARLGLSVRIPDLERHLAAGNVEILPGGRGTSTATASMSSGSPAPGTTNCAAHWPKAMTACAQAATRSRFTPNIGNTFAITSASSAALWRASR